MSIEVIGAGFGRTGTLSLKFALEKLGFDKCYHMMEVQMNPSHRDLWRDAAAGRPVDWAHLFAGYKATVDWPSCNFWEQQMAAFPDARVLLSLRDPDKWYDSVMNTIWHVTEANSTSDDAEVRAGTQFAFDVVWDPVFGRRMEDKSHVIAQYQAHNKRVMDRVPADKLLVYEPGQGWEPLCAFLGRPVPDEDYPRVNSTEEFTTRWRGIAAEARDKKA